MNIMFLSNFLLHHQTEFCETMYQLTNGNFVFVATSPITEERLKLGYHDYSKNAPSYYIDATVDIHREIVINLVNEADAVIIGSAPWWYVDERVKQGKLTFIYAERIFKDFVGSVKAILKGTVRNRFVLPGKKGHVRLLCASAYLPMEMRFFHTFKNRMYRWGYFSPFIEYEEDTEVNEPIEILWCGRLIKYKRPEFAIKLGKHLQKKNINAHITIIGTGKKEEKIKQLIRKNNLDSIINMAGAMSPEEVRKKMRESDIFIFTANRQEGWGAVQNEAMNGCCAVVSSDKIGSTPFLIQNGINGVIFKNSSCRHFCSCVKNLCDDKEKMLLLQKNAYASILNEWNAITGAERLYELITAILSGKDTPFETGPCSKING